MATTSRAASTRVHLPLWKDMMVKLFWAGVIFGAGYVLGRAEGSAKLAELLKQPEVAQLSQQATSIVSSGAKTGSTAAGQGRPQSEGQGVGSQPGRPGRDGD